MPDWVARDQRRAYDFRRGEAAEPPRALPFRYYAAVSYVDEHVGAIVAALRDGGKYDESIVVFHSDHGYHLGEHGEREPAAADGGEQPGSDGNKGPGTDAGQEQKPEQEPGSLTPLF